MSLDLSACWTKCEVHSDVEHPKKVEIPALESPLMAGVQEICDRTALATGKSFGELASTRFQRTGQWIIAVLLFVLIVANTLSIAADLVAIGSGMNLFKAGPAWLWALLAG